MAKLKAIAKVIFRPAIILSAVLLISLIVILSLFFSRQLKRAPLITSNLPFSEEGFIDFTTKYDENGNAVPQVYNNNKLVAENRRFQLFIDEETTIATLIDKEKGNRYTTAQPYTGSASAASADSGNLLVYYGEEKTGKEAQVPFNSLHNSVKFENQLTEVEESHYKIKYLPEAGAVQILYEIGRFSANRDYFPIRFAKVDWRTERADLKPDELKALQKAHKYTLEGRFEGNIQFNRYYKFDEVERRYILSYHSDFDVKTMVGFAPITGKVYSPAAAAYIEENNLALLTPINNDPSGDPDAIEYWEMELIDESFVDSYGTHLNSDQSPCIHNPFLSNLDKSNLRSVSYSTFVPEGEKERVYGFSQQAGHLILKDTYRMMYQSEQELRREVGVMQKYPVFDEKGEPVIRGGFHAVDAEGRYLYDDEGRPLQKTYSLELAMEDNARFNLSSSISLTVFQVGLQLKLTERGMDATIIGDSLKDISAAKTDKRFDHGTVMSRIVVNKEMGVVRDQGLIAADGEYIIPDGSGALIQFNNGKAEYGVPGYISPVYGRDHAYKLHVRPEETKDLMFGMFGMIDRNDDRGMIVSMEKGAARSKLAVDTPRGIRKYNSAYFETRLREREEIQAGASWSVNTFPKYAKKLCQEDIELRYLVLKKDVPLNYSSLAQIYRDYLIERDEIKPKDTTRYNVVDLNFLGAFERLQLTLGVKHKVSDHLTTFAEAREIIEQLRAAGVEHFNVGYEAWTNREMEPQFENGRKASKRLGGGHGLDEFSRWLAAENITFAPQVNVTSGKGFKYPFGPTKYATRSVGNEVAKQHPFRLGTMLPDQKLAPTYYLRPELYEAVSKRMLKSLDKYELTGIMPYDLGNLSAGDYRRGKELMTSEAVIYQKAALALYREHYAHLVLARPFDYALKYADFITDAPLTASLYGIFDAHIPFYQLVVSGICDYSTEKINARSNNSLDWFLLKALETGSNLRYQLSYTDPRVLLKTDYTQFYNAYYKNWLDEIVAMDKAVNRSGIHGGRLTAHEILGKNVARSTYTLEGGKTIDVVINGSTGEFVYESIVIAPFDYLVRRRG